jgi:hypothetical protein
VEVAKLDEVVKASVANNQGYGKRAHGCEAQSLFILAIANIFVSAHNVQTFIEASEETLANGGFLGGEVINNTIPANRKLTEVVSKHMPVTYESVGNFS